MCSSLQRCAGGHSHKLLNKTILANIRRVLPDLSAVSAMSILGTVAALPWPVEYETVVRDVMSRAMSVRSHSSQLSVLLPNDRVAVLACRTRLGEPASKGLSNDDAIRLILSDEHQLHCQSLLTVCHVLPSLGVYDTVTVERLSEAIACRLGAEDGHTIDMSVAPSEIVDLIVALESTGSVNLVVYRQLACEMLKCLPSLTVNQLFQASWALHAMGTNMPDMWNRVVAHIDDTYQPYYSTMKPKDLLSFAYLLTKLRDVGDPGNRPECRRCVNVERALAPHCAHIGLRLLPQMMYVVARGHRDVGERGETLCLLLKRLQTEVLQPKRFPDVPTTMRLLRAMRGCAELADKSPDLDIVVKSLLTNCVLPNLNALISKEVVQVVMTCLDLDVRYAVAGKQILGRVQRDWRAIDQNVRPRLLRGIVALGVSEAEVARELSVM
eukprot:PhM_4_TR10378/c0_g1_i1/m.83995